jgi:hypothetical protein
MRGRFRESELVEAPPHRAEIQFSLGACCPLPARGARKAAPLGNRSKCQRRHPYPSSPVGTFWFSLSSFMPEASAIVSIRAAKSFCR